MTGSSFELAGTSSEQVEPILAVGDSGVHTLYVSMSGRHPGGKDADYLAWHSLDHRPEQYRISSLRGSLRLVSTPACRAARAAGDGPLGAADHVMTYFFADLSGMPPFDELSTALRDAGRTPYLLPMVERGIYDVRATAVTPGVKVGADVLPWWPAAGVYLLVEPASTPATELVDVPGVAGVWSAVAVDGGHMGNAPVGQQVTYCFLDDDPVQVAARLRPVLEERWRAAGASALLAAPFHVVVPRDWDRYLP